MWTNVLRLFYTDDRLQMEGLFCHGAYAFTKRELYEILIGGNISVCMYSHVFCMYAHVIFSCMYFHVILTCMYWHVLTVFWTTTCTHMNSHLHVFACIYTTFDHCLCYFVYFTFHLNEINMFTFNPCAVLYNRSRVCLLIQSWWLIVNEFDPLSSTETRTWGSGWAQSYWAVLHRDRNAKTSAYMGA